MPLEKYKRLVMLTCMVLIIAALLCALAVLINKTVERKIYQISHEPCIKGCAREYGLKGSLICAVIFCESGWDENALSPKGAMGLMQIMPDTGKWISEMKEEPEEQFQSEKLYSAETNIDYGCWYLRFLLDRYDNDLRYALIAYNAGLGNLDKWLKDTEYTKDGRLEIIPFVQTAEYVERVCDAMEKYEEIYSDSLD